MRTTIEISDDTLRKLRELAARRGEKGYSRIVEEALGEYLAAGATLAETRAGYDVRQAPDAMAGAIIAPLRDAAPGTRAAMVREVLLRARARPGGGYTRNMELALLDYALQDPDETEEERAAATSSVEGAWSDEVAEEVRAKIRESRSHWR